MKRIVPVLVSLAGCALLFSQPRVKGTTWTAVIGAVNMESAPAVAETAAKLRVAQSAVLAQQDIVLKAREKAKTDPGAEKKALEEQAKLEAAQKAAQEAAKRAGVAAAAQPRAFVSQEQRAHLAGLAERFYREVKEQEKSASALALGLLLAGAGFGLVSAIFSIFTWNRAATVASAFVVVLGGAQKLYPAQERASYYRTLTNQSYGLLGTLQIPYRMTVTEYDDGVAKLKILQEYWAVKYPSSGDIESTTRELFRDLTAAVVNASTN